MSGVSRLAGVLLVVVVCITGCRTDDNFSTADGFVSPLKPADITYEALAGRYNAAIGPITALWSRADIGLEWAEVDEDGDRRVRSEGGTGKFIMRRGEKQSHIAMTVEKLGKIYLWAGSNQTSYYLFDRVDADNKTLYVGGHGYTGLSKPFPLPIQPSMVPILLGLEPLPVQAFSASDVTIDLYRGQYLLDCPTMGRRMLIDPRTFRPTRVDLTDRSGYSVLTANLSGQLQIEGAELAGGATAIICEKAEIYVAGFESRFTLEFETATTSKRRIRDRMFDLDALKKALKPDRVVDLDQP